MEEDFNYVDSEFRKLNTADTYRVKVWSEAGGETRWINLPAVGLSEIQRVLRENDTN